jgi:RNA polymerase sigma factor (sigma-70 family)
MSPDTEHWFVSAILPHRAALTRYLKRVCRSSSDVPDLCQEALVRVFEVATTSRPRSPKTFLFRTARNLLIDMLRRERVVSFEYAPDAFLSEFSIDELTPERRLSAREEMQHLSRAFARLPERTRSVIWLRRVSGLSQREAAAIVGIEEGALEGHMTRGLRNLAKALS